MRCSECKHWFDVRADGRRRCLLACPQANKKDKAHYALTTASDGCAAGEAADGAGVEVAEINGD